MTILHNGKTVIALRRLEGNDRDFADQYSREYEQTVIKHTDGRKIEVIFTSELSGAEAYEAAAGAASPAELDKVSPSSFGKVPIHKQPQTHVLDPALKKAAAAETSTSKKGTSR